MNKSFKGRIADGGQETIRLSTNNGLTGYKIIKFQLMQTQPGAVVGEHTVKIFSNEQDSVDGVIDFTDPTLLAAGHLKTHTSEIYPDTITVVFDNLKFNQDIHITHADIGSGNQDINFYIELEQSKLSRDEATVATLKDMRAGPDTNFGP